MKTILRITISFVFVILLINSCLSQNNDAIKGKYIIVLDVQEEYTKSMMTDSFRQILIKNINSVIEKADTEKVIYIKSMITTACISANATMSFRVGISPGFALDRELKVVSKNIFSKAEASAFTCEGFQNFIRVNNAKDFVVIGLMAEGCVLETVTGGEKLGYIMYIITDAIAGKTIDGKAAVIKKLIKNGVKQLKTS
jgi:nicotinamidase-related amidase